MVLQTLKVMNVLVAEKKIAQPPPQQPTLTLLGSDAKSERGRCWPIFATYPQLKQRRERFPNGSNTCTPY